MYALIIDGEVVKYPYSLAEMRADNPDTSFGAEPSDETMAEFGRVEVAPSDTPPVAVEQVAEEVEPALIEGAWTQQWTVRDKTSEELAEAKQAKRQAVTQKLASIFAGGFTPAIGPLAGKTLQTRDMEDRTNWLTSQAAYSAAVAAGQGSEEGAVFRTAANETIATTYQNGLLTLLAMAAWGKAIMGHSWSLKDEIEAAQSFADLAAIDIEAGWPS
ncbi:MAG: hypothetical protein WCY32_13865 [Burkholderiaceae bacterium]